MYFSFNTDQREAAEGSRVSRLKRRGDGKEGGRGRGWLGDATGNAAAPAAAGSGGLTAGARRTGGRQSRESVRGGRWRRLLFSLRQEQLQAAAGSSGHGGGCGGGSSLQTPGSGSSTAPHTPGTWEPGNRFRPLGPPPPSAAPARPPSRPSPLLGARSGSVRALPPARSPVSGCGAGSSSLPSFLPLSLGPGGGGGGGGGSTSLHSPGSGAALCEERRLRSRLALPHSPSPLLLVLRLLPPPPSLTPPSAPPPA
ncbi:alanine and glycine-rich protein-like [Zalophus californianus]|uniref:Alanine and glycine-rich protein-like n=1 Tax=Zalophus californianus TaxID=9704 RepID=A0A6P9FCA7_ZALCA|nr:alanine and glycine-rich protein-like [Zalophus californianus]